MGEDILCGISLWNSTQNIVPIHWKMIILYNVENLRALTFKSSKAFLKLTPGSAFIKRDQPDPWIKDQIKTILLSTISPLQLPNFVSCGRDKPSHMTQSLVTVGTKLWTAERFLVDPWSMDQADLVW